MPLITYSPKVFIPLTKLCRDVCHYCTFAQPPRRGERVYMRADEVLEIARAGAEAGCHEALFTLGDKPELRYRSGARGARRARLRDDDRVPRPHVRARPRRDRPAPAREPGCHGARRARAPPDGLGLAGDHVGDHLGAAVAEGRAALRLPGQAPRAAPGDHRARRRACDPVHHRDPDRNRRDAGGAARGARGDPRHARALRPHPGSDRPELPRKAGDEDGRRAGAVPRRPALDCPRGARGAWARHARPGAAQPLLRRVSRASSRPGSTTGAASRPSPSTT